MTLIIRFYISSPDRHDRGWKSATTKVQQLFTLVPVSSTVILLIFLLFFINLVETIVLYTLFRAKPQFYFVPWLSRDLFGDRHNPRLHLCLYIVPWWTTLCPSSVYFVQYPLIRQEAYCFVVYTFGETGFSWSRSIFHCIGALKYPEEFHWLVTTSVLLC